MCVIHALLQYGIIQNQVGFLHFKETVSLENLQNFPIKKYMIVHYWPCNYKLI